MNVTSLCLILDAYTEAALWADFLDSKYESRADGADYSFSDFTKAAQKDMREDCESFVSMAGDLLEGLDSSQIGHDFWLTRQGHGAGFWDRGLGERGWNLTAIAKTFGSGQAVVMLRGGKLTIEG